MAKREVLETHPDDTFVVTDGGIDGMNHHKINFPPNFSPYWTHPARFANPYIMSELGLVIDESAPETGSNIPPQSVAPTQEELTAEIKALTPQITKYQMLGSLLANPAAHPFANTFVHNHIPTVALQDRRPQRPEA